MVWSNEENRKLIEEHYPAFLATYLGLKAEISRADAVRRLKTCLLSKTLLHIGFCGAVLVSLILHVVFFGIPRKVRGADCV